MTTIQACVNPRLLKKADRLLTGTLNGRIIEILQNARRAGATKVVIANKDDSVPSRINRCMRSTKCSLCVSMMNWLRCFVLIASANKLPNSAWRRG